MKRIRTKQKAPFTNWGKHKTTYDLKTPSIHSKVCETVRVEIDVWNTLDGDLIIPPDVQKKLDVLKARLRGLVSPQDLRDLRKELKLTQKEISELLQIGEKTWTRWESGRERPSRSLNLLLHALRDGKIDLEYLCEMATQN